MGGVSAWSVCTSGESTITHVSCKETNRSASSKNGIYCICAISGIKDDKFLEVAGPSGEGVLSIKPGKPIEKLEGGTKFVRAYGAAGYREPFGAYGPNAYDSAGILLEAISKVGPDNKDAIGKYVRGIKYRGLMGETTFDATGQTTNIVVSRFVGQDGKWVEWEESAYAKGTRKLPPP